VLFVREQDQRLPHQALAFARAVGGRGVAAGGAKKRAGVRGLPLSLDKPVFQGASVARARRLLSAGWSGAGGAAGTFGDEDSGDTSGLGRSNSTDCAPFSTTIERKAIPRTRQPSFSSPTRSREIASGLVP
jgi:hypothetical protein